MRHFKAFRNTGYVPEGGISVNRSLRNGEPLYTCTPHPD